jgi:predicted Fe-S protein YdhL (DUF1289 family)
MSLPSSTASLRSRDWFLFFFFSFLRDWFFKILFWEIDFFKGLGTYLHDTRFLYDVLQHLPTTIRIETNCVARCCVALTKMFCVNRPRTTLEFKRWKYTRSTVWMKNVKMLQFKKQTPKWLHPFLPYRDFTYRNNVCYHLPLHASLLCEFMDATNVSMSKVKLQNANK